MTDNANANDGITPDVNVTIEEGEVVGEKSTSGASVALDLEAIIKRHISKIDTLKNEVKKQQEMLEDVLTHDETYRLHAEKVKEATKVKNGTKQQLLKAPSIAEAAGKVKNLKSELKEMQKGLSDYLQEFQKVSGMNEIEGDNGEVHQIVFIAKLIRAARKNE